jgi:hypothetical protein
MEWSNEERELTSISHTAGTIRTQYSIIEENGRPRPDLTSTPTRHIIPLKSQQVTRVGVKPIGIERKDVNALPPGQFFFCLFLSSPAKRLIGSLLSCPPLNSIPSLFFETSSRDIHGKRLRFVRIGGSRHHSTGLAETNASAQANPPLTLHFQAHSHSSITFNITNTHHHGLWNSQAKSSPRIYEPAESGCVGARRMFRHDSIREFRPGRE